MIEKLPLRALSTGLMISTAVEDKINEIIDWINNQDSAEQVKKQL